MIQDLPQNHAAARCLQSYADLEAFAEDVIADFAADRPDVAEAFRGHVADVRRARCELYGLDPATGDETARAMAAAFLLLYTAQYGSPPPLSALSGRREVTTQGVTT